MTKEDVESLCAKAAIAQKSWALTTYAQRRMVLRTIQKYIVAHQEDICRVSARDSGKPKVDALLGTLSSPLSLSLVIILRSSSLTCQELIIDVCR